MIETAAAFGVEAERRRGMPGCWVRGRKLGSVGVRVADGVSRHGLALNVCTDLTWFKAITPCGLAGVEMTSLEQELGRSRDALGAHGASLLHSCAGRNPGGHEIENGLPHVDGLPLGRSDAVEHVRRERGTAVRLDSCLRRNDGSAKGVSVGAVADAMLAALDDLFALRLGADAAATR